jgi:hypothetical protein
MNEIVLAAGDKQFGFNFGIGALEAFCEANGIEDVNLQAVFALVAGPKALKKVPELLLCFVERYHQVRREPCPFTRADIVDAIDATGGLRSTFKDAVLDAFVRYIDPDPNNAERGPAEIVNTAEPAKNSPGRNSAPKRSAKSA